MIWALLVSFAGTPQEIAEAEWRRTTVEQLIAIGPAEDPRPWLRALGRTREGAALAPLQQRIDGPHRETVLFALGLVPGSAGLLRTQLGADSEGREGDDLWLVLEGLGRQGNASDIPRLVAFLDRGWPYDAAAARGILRLHRRGHDGSRAITALARGAEDPRSEIELAQALARIAEPGQVDVQWRMARTSAARAALLKVAAGDGADADAIRLGLLDSSLVRIAALEGIAANGDARYRADVERHLGHPEIQVRLAAVRAAGSVEMHDVLEALQPESVAERAAIAAVLGATQPFHQAWLDDPRVVAAQLGLVDDPDALFELTDGEHAPIVRTAALTRLLELEPGQDRLLKLLERSDPAVREAVLEALEPSAKAIDEVVLAMRVESHVEPLAMGFQQLTTWKRAGQRVRGDRYLTSALKRGMRSTSARVRLLAIDLATELGLELQPPPAPVQERELILPDGTVTTTRGDLPRLEQVARIAAATIETTAGPIEIVLDHRRAPLAVHNFAALARSGFYDGQRFHRVVPGFVAQAGCPRDDGWGGPGWMIVDEVSEAPFVDGAIGMARADRDTGGSQFFLMTGPARFLDGDYTWFGTVSEGLDVARSLDEDDLIQRIVIRSGDDDGS